MMQSIRRQIAVITLALVLGTLFLCWGINNVFVGKLYYLRRQSSLIEVYNTVNQVTDIMSVDSDEFELLMEEFCDNYNMSIMIVDASFNVIYCSTNANYDTLKTTIANYIFGDSVYVNGNNTTVLKESDEYKLNMTTDARFGTNYLEMTGVFDNGYFFSMRLALESIRENLAFSNQVLAVIGVCVMLFTTVCILFISGRLTRPLNDLISLSNEMANLNFDVKYVGGGTEEIDILGEHMNQLSEKLEETISELKTANNELKRDIEQKTQIDEMRKDFLSNVSHELKTPIALIQGYAEGLQECINDDEESRNFYCEVIIDEAKKMNGMVQKLLTLNEIEFGNDTVSMERFDMTTLVQNSINSMTLLADQKNVVISCNTTQPCFVWSDEYKVGEVFTNYMSNALNHVKYDNKIEVRIQRMEEEKKVRVSVFNTGDPIPEDDIDKIWIKFYKVDKARTREYGGSVVGLSIVKAILDSMNQECGVTNYDNGVEFWFTMEAG